MGEIRIRTRGGPGQDGEGHPVQDGGISMSGALAGVCEIRKTHRRRLVGILVEEVVADKICFVHA